MPNPFVNQLDPLNDLPRRSRADDQPVSRKIDAECGYAVLDRADPGSYDRSRRGLTPRVYEGPNIPMDEE